MPHGTPEILIEQRFLPRHRNPPYRYGPQRTPVRGQIKTAHCGAVEKQLTRALLRLIPVAVLGRIELQLAARGLVDLGRAQRRDPFLPLLYGASRDADRTRYVRLGAKMRNDFGSKHDASVSLLSRSVKYASTGPRLSSSPMANTMGDRIKTLREAKGMTQEELAKALGVTRAAVSLWELGNTKNIKNVTFLALVQLLGTNQEYLLFGPVADREPTGKFRRPPSA